MPSKTTGSCYDKRGDDHQRDHRARSSAAEREAVSNDSSTVRYHDLDSLRATAMFLGIVIHSAMSFLTLSPKIWVAQDVRADEWANLVVYLIHAFRMQLFFVLAGFFGCMLYQRYTTWGLLRHRLQRIALPLLLASFTVQPLMQLCWLYGERREFVRGITTWETSASERRLMFGKPTDPTQPPGQAVREHLLSGAFLRHIEPYHLWFLYYLLYHYAAMLLLCPLASSLAQTAMGRTIDAGFRGALRRWWGCLVFSVALWPMLLPMRTWMADTPTSWRPEVHLIGYYFVFFTVGWMLYRHRDCLDDFTRHWLAAGAVGLLGVLPLTLVATMQALGNGNEASLAPLDSAAFLGRKAGVAFGYGVLNWLLIIGAIGAFRRWLAHESAWGRWLAEASYWCYLMHLLPILLLQILLAEVEANGLLKFALINGCTLALLLLSYRWLVRDRWIGRLLNGSRAARREMECRATPIPPDEGACRGMPGDRSVSVPSTY